MLCQEQNIQRSGVEWNQKRRSLHCRLEKWKTQHLLYFQKLSGEWIGLAQATEPPKFQDHQSLGEAQTGGRSPNRNTQNGRSVWCMSNGKID